MRPAPTPFTGFLHLAFCVPEWSTSKAHRNDLASDDLGFGLLSHGKTPSPPPFFPFFFSDLSLYYTEDRPAGRWPRPVPLKLDNFPAFFQEAFPTPSLSEMIWISFFTRSRSPRSLFTGYLGSLVRAVFPQILNIFFSYPFSFSRSAPHLRENLCLILNRFR